MKRLTQLLPLLLIAAVMLPAAVNAAGYRYIRPTAYDEDIHLSVSDKSRHYFVLRETNMIQVSVKGPSKLKVMTRLALDSKKDKPEYSFEYTMDDGDKAKSISHKTKSSSETAYEDGRDEPIGVLRKEVIEVPRGKHTFTFRLLDDSDHVIFTRFSQKTNEFTGGTPVVAMTPFEYTSSVDIVSPREERYTYYRVSSKDRVVLKLVGPATLKVLNRIEYDSKMQGKQKWKVQVLEDGSEKRVLNLAATKSEVNVYRESNDLVPSRAETFYLEIPEGEHVYEFKLPENHRTAIFRFLLPKSQLDRD